MKCREGARFGAGIAVVAAVLLSACSGGGSGSGLEVVAAENVYGDIAAQIGGPDAHVTSILTNPSADPHLFEPGTATAAEVSAARVVIENGLGYDAFIDRLLSAAPSSDRSVVTVADVLRVRGADANPHLWYDIPRMPAVATAIERALSVADPTHGDAFRRRLQVFEHSLGPLERAVATIKRQDAGAPVAYTEPVPGYLLEAAGLVVRTPDAFARAIEEGNEPTAQAVATMEALMRGRRVRVLLYNSQATSPITDHIRALARTAGIPVVGVTETLPPGATYQSWQLGQIRALGKALGA